MTRVDKKTVMGANFKVSHSMERLNHDSSLWMKLESREKTGEWATLVFDKATAHAKS